MTAPRPATLVTTTCVSLRGDVVGGISNLLRRGRMVQRDFSPEIAWVEEGEIRIGSYQGRLPA